MSKKHLQIKEKIMIEIYGSPKSSSGRCFWCLEELGVEYQAKSIDFRAKEHKSEDYLKINPNGKVPALKDGDFVIWESMAINFYLAEKFRPICLGKNIEERSLARQWSFWAIADLQSPMIDVFIQLVFVPEDRRSQAVIDKAMAKLPDMFKTLNNTLSSDAFLIGAEFSIADLNVASVVNLHKEIGFDISEFKNVQNWLGRVSDTPSFQKYQKLCEA